MVGRQNIRMLTCCDKTVPLAIEALIAYVPIQRVELDYSTHILVPQTSIRIRIAFKVAEIGRLQPSARQGFAVEAYLRLALVVLRWWWDGSVCRFEEVEYLTNLIADTNYKISTSTSCQR
jgi:hypothetical protein